MIKQFVNIIRNFLIFRIRFPWVRYGRDVHCQLGAYFWSPHKHIVLGDQVGIGFRCLFQCDTEIGNQVMIASEVAFVNSDDHRFDVLGKAMWDSGRGDQFKIVVEDDVWIGHGATILTPAVIGEGSIIAAGSVVTGDVPAYSIVGGVPARIIKARFSAEEIAKHRALLALKGS